MDSYFGISVSVRFYLAAPCFYFTSILQFNAGVNRSPLTGILAGNCAEPVQSLRKSSAVVDKVVETWS